MQPMGASSHPTHNSKLCVHIAKVVASAVSEVIKLFDESPYLERKYWLEEYAGDSRIDSLRCTMHRIYWRRIEPQVEVVFRTEMKVSRSFHYEMTNSVNALCQAGGGRCRHPTCC
jgi:ADP-ribosylglycohydrolase